MHTDPPSEPPAPHSFFQYYSFAQYSKKSPPVQHPDNGCTTGKIKDSGIQSPAQFRLHKNSGVPVFRTAPPTPYKLQPAGKNLDVSHCSKPSRFPGLRFRSIPRSARKQRGSVQKLQFWTESLILNAMFKIKSSRCKDLILNSSGYLKSNRLFRYPSPPIAHSVYDGEWETLTTKKGVI